MGQAGAKFILCNSSSQQQFRRHCWVPNNACPLNCRLKSISTASIQYQHSITSTVSIRILIFILMHRSRHLLPSQHLQCMCLLGSMIHKPRRYAWQCWKAQHTKAFKPLMELNLPTLSLRSQVWTVGPAAAASPVCHAFIQALLINACDKRRHSEHCPSRCPRASALPKPAGNTITHPCVLCFATWKSTDCSTHCSILRLNKRSVWACHVESHCVYSKRDKRQDHACED